MKELSLFLLDIAKNSVEAGAELTEVSLIEDGGKLTLRVSDNGSGMAPEFLARVTDPFTTTRTTRKVGMGIPLLKMTAEMTGGSFQIRSTMGVGTCVAATFMIASLDMPPLGDIAGSVVTLIQGSPDQDFLYTRVRNGTGFSLDTREIRSIMGGIPLNAPPVLNWITEFLKENEAELNGT